MADRPILFSAPMVRALLDGRKTQTRRILKPQPGPDGIYPDIRSAKKALRIVPKDRLWVREAIRAEDHSETWNHGVRYLADEAWAQFADHGDVSSDTYGRWWTVKAYRSDDPDLTGGKTVPPIHMPRWASRLTLTVTGVTDVRVQRLHDISEEDAWAEGCKQGHPDDVGGFFPAEEPNPSGIGFRGWDNARDWYADLWDAINGEGAWDANPWIVAYSFTVERRNIDAAAAEAA